MDEFGEVSVPRPYVRRGYGSGGAGGADGADDGDSSVGGGVGEVVVDESAFALPIQAVAAMTTAETTAKRPIPVIF